MNLSTTDGKKSVSYTDQSVAVLLEFPPDGKRGGDWFENAVTTRASYPGGLRIRIIIPKTRIDIHSPFCYNILIIVSVFSSSIASHHYYYDK